MLILGLDASTTAVGWCLLRDGEYESSGVFKPKGDDWRQRIGRTRNWLDDWLYELKYLYDDYKLTVAYEIASGEHRNMATNRKLGAVEWACWEAAWNNALDWLPVNVRHVKRAAANKTPAGMLGARSISGKQDISGDEADAIGVALAAMWKMRRALG